MFETYKSVGNDDSVEAPFLEERPPSTRNNLCPPRPSTVAWVLTILGILLRLAIFAENRPFWTDEAQLALNLIDRSYGGLMERLDYCQAAPLGFLFMEKVMLIAFGESEYVLRMIPLLAGVLSQILFWQLANRVLPDRAVPLAVGLFALSEPLLRYSSELKPYSLDVLVNVSLLLIGHRVLGQSRRKGGLILLAMAATLSPWVSYASPLTMAGILGTVFWVYYKERVRQSLLLLLMIGLVWAVSLFGVYYLSLENLVNSSCKDALMDFRAAIPHNATAVIWLYRKFQELLLYPFGLSVIGCGVGMLCALAGAFSLRSKEKAYLCILMAPLVLALIGSWCGIYPFFGRFLLFSCPPFQLLVAAGASILWIRLVPLSIPLALTLIVTLFLPRLDWIALSGNSILVNRIDVRAVMQHVAINREPGDKIYIYYGGYFPAIYYGLRFGLTKDDIQVGVPGYWWNRELRAALLAEWKRANCNVPLPAESVFDSYGKGDFSQQWSLFENDVNHLVGNPRVWMVFSHSVWLGSDEERLFLYFLDKRGRRLQEYKQSGASAYLYDLRCLEQ